MEDIQKLVVNFLKKNNTCCYQVEKFIISNKDLLKEKVKLKKIKIK